MSGSSSREYPRISIITPSYNQGHFIEETIRSVLNQGYPNLEYLIIDGGSTDNTVEIIKKYESQITYWVSEPDRGQTHAINKGLAQATGDILAYLNSDDYYLPGTLLAVAEYFQQHPEIDLLHGRCCYVNEAGEAIGEQFGNIQTFAEILDLWGVWWQKRQFVQPEVFWTRRISDRIGGFNDALYYVMDYEYWSRILQAGGKVGRLDRELSCFRFTPSQKSTHASQVADELLTVVQPWLWDSATPLSQQQRLVLQGQWLYQAVLLKHIAASVQAGDSKVLRWLKSAIIALQNPQIFWVPGFRTRASQYFSRLLQIS
jgi:glycosyltransferase involved in cell wall biosynthesis